MVEELAVFQALDIGNSKNLLADILSVELSLSYDVILK